ncbi:MAG: TonB-dependent receptor [Bacteroidetes bacterium]|nr:TonB-dependent receptor [Bacteroidota bacterium]MBS1973639.1 TonB-dependent receptor [Bacteroidota bacterium]
MKKIFTLIAAFGFSFPVFAQAPGMAPGGRPQAAPNIGHIYGKLVDSAGKPISDATVLLLHNRFDTVSKKMKEVLYKGLTTKANGDFSFDELPVFGTMKLKLSATGFKPSEENVSFKLQMPSGQKPSGSGDMGQALNSFDRDLGNIRLETDVKQLQAVVVTASKPTLKMDIDKKVYNVEKDIVNAGGTALDVMKNVPAVNVDIDGNVTLRNTTPQIYIEGRPTTLTLDQIPADAIESVEVITNPSAKYDASGGGSGILNIILKKNRKTGYNGNVRAGVDKYGGINGGGDFNVRQGKFNVSAAAFVNQRKGISTGTTDRTNFGDTSTDVHQLSTNKDNGGFIFARLGVDYFMTNRTSFSLGLVKLHGEMKPYQFLTSTIDSSYNGNEFGSTYSERNTSTSRIFNGQGMQFGLKHLFPKEGETWTADMNLFSGKNTNNSLYSTNYFAHGAGSNIIDNSQQKTIGTGNDQFLTVQTDYTKPFSAKTKLETGLRMQQQKLTNSTYNYYLDNSTNDFLLSDASSINYKNTNNVFAAYASVTSSIKKFGYQLGLRAESSSYSGDLVSTKQHFSNSYPISLFPSVFLSQKFEGNNELQLSYTRRINRPNFFQLIPYTDYSDSLNITRGNPNLVPEFTNSFEFSYLKTLPHNNTLLASLYYKRTNNLITRFLDTAKNELTGKQDIINTYVNANSSYTAGGEFTVVANLVKWWDMTLDLNVYNSKINTDNLNTASQAALWSWFGKINNNFKLPAKFKLQVTGIYQSKTNLPVNSNNGQMGGPPMMQSQSSSQGYIRAFYSVDAAVSRSFLKNDAATVSLSISDIFRSRRSDQHSVSQFFVQDYDRLRDPQLLRLNFSYRFGKMDVSLFKRKNNNMSNMDTGQGMQQ